MAVTYVVESDHIHFHCVGETEYEEGLAAYLRGFHAAAEADRGRSWDVLFDLSRCDQTLEEPALDGIAALLQSQGATLSGRCVLLVQEPFFYGIAKVFADVAEARGMDVAVCTTLDDAHAWLRPPSIATSDG